MTHTSFFQHRHFRLCTFLLALLQIGRAQQVSFRLTPVRPVEELRAEALKEQPPREERSFLKRDLVELVKLDPTIKLDIRYATTNNFLGTPLYTEARAFLQRPAAEALLRAHRELKAQGYGLIIHEGYRPWYIAKIFWDAVPDDKKIFVGNRQRDPNITADAQWTCLYMI
jgi:D-alanyl-D-alanine dipeptidase